MAYVSCNFNCVIETDGLLRVTDSHVYIAKVVGLMCKIETLLLQTISTLARSDMWRIEYRHTMDVRTIQSAGLTSLFKCDF